MYFRTHGLRKPSLHKCLKGPVSEATLTSNKVNGPKHWWNLSYGTFIRFIDTCEENYGWKILSDWYAKSWDCFLTHRLPVTSIPFLTDATYCNIFRCIYLRNDKFFLSLFLHFLNLDSSFKIFNKTTILIADVFLNLGTPKNVVK